jgi:hypothetical protein
MLGTWRCFPSFRYDPVVFRPRCVFPLLPAPIFPFSLVGSKHSKIISAPMPPDVDVAPTEAQSTRVARFFAHPATLTVVGGILIALLTTLFQFLSANTQQALSFRQQLRDKKYQLLAAVAEGFHRDVIVMHKLKKMKGWLSHHKEGDKFDGTFTRDEIWTLYQTVFEQYLKENRTSALMTQVEALFGNAEVHEEAKHLDDLFMNIDIELSPEHDQALEAKLEQFYRRTEETLRKLERSMAEEIKHT